MTTPTQRKRRWGRKPADTSAPTVLLDTLDATDEAAEFVYAVIAALGLNIVELTDADDEPKAATLQVSKNVICAGAQRWHYPDHEATFEQWLVSRCFARPDHTTAWAVVQTGADTTYPLLAPAMAYAVCADEAVLIDADASGALTDAIDAGTTHGIDVLEYDMAMPSPHVYLLNAPRFADVTMMLQRNRANPLNSVLLIDTLHAAQQHFGQVVINCGADLFLAQRLAAEGVHVVHVDDFSHPVKVKFQRHKHINYFSTRIPDYGKRRDFEFITTNTRHRSAMRRWMHRGDT